MILSHLLEIEQILCINPKYVLFVQKNYTTTKHNSITPLIKSAITFGIMVIRKFQPNEMLPANQYL